MLVPKTITGKLSLNLVGVALLLALLSAISLYSIHRLGRNMDQVANWYARKVDLAAQLNSDLATNAAVLRGMMMQAMLGNQASTGSFGARVSEIRARMDRIVRQAQPLMENEREKQSLSQLQSDLLNISQLSDRMIAALSSQHMDVALKLQTEQLMPLQERSMQQVQDFARLQREGLASAAQGASAAVTSATILVAVFVLLACGAVAGSIWVGRTAAWAFRRMAGELSADASRVAEVSAQVSAASRELAEGASEQASSLEETSASMEEINATIQKNAENSRRSSDCAALAGSTLMEVNSKFRRLTDVMNDINSSSEKISKINKVIDEIAFQTNILALNAAVEAARAGEAGLSFAVVADAVRDLAQRSAQAAKDTAELIEESIRNSREGRVQTDLMTKAMQDVTAHAQQANALSNEVNRGSADQAQRIEQIVCAIRQMQQLTQRTAGHAEGTAAAGSEMSAVSVNLRESAGRFQEMVGSSSAA